MWRVRQAKKLNMAHARYMLNKLDHSFSLSHSLTHSLTHTHTHIYIILIAFPRQYLFRKHASVLRHTYVYVCFVWALKAAKCSLGRAQIFCIVRPWKQIRKLTLARRISLKSTQKFYLQMVTRNTVFTCHAVNSNSLIPIHLSYIVSDNNRL